jgi:heme/copper-type cytochrome/quinol oxidase subunit 2
MVIQLATLLWVLGICSSIIGALLIIVFKDNQRRLKIQDDANVEIQKTLTSILSEISAIKAGNIGYITTNTCNANNKEAEKKFDAKILEVKTEVFEEIEAVEFRLDKRISHLENKVA